MDFPGPICQTLGICCEDVRNRSLQKLDSLNNGLVLEINEFCKKENLTVQQIVEVLGCLNDNFINANAKAVHIKILRVPEQKRKLISRKKN